MGKKGAGKRKADEPETCDVSPWTAEEQHDADCVLDVDGTKLHIPRALLTMCSPVFRDSVRALGADEDIPILGFEASQVSAFLKFIHPGIDVDPTAKLILEAAPVAHYFQVFVVLDQFVRWLTQFNDAETPPDESMDAILLMERLRVRTPGQLPWSRKVLTRAMETRLCKQT